MKRLHNHQADFLHKALSGLRAADDDHLWLLEYFLLVSTPAHEALDHHAEAWPPGYSDLWILNRNLTLTTFCSQTAWFLSFKATGQL